MHADFFYFRLSDFDFSCIFCLKVLFKVVKAGLSGMEKLGQYEASIVNSDSVHIWPCTLGLTN